MHLLVSELYIYQNVRCNNKKKAPLIFHRDAYLTRTVVKHNTTQNFTVYQKGIKKEERCGHVTH